ncbi:MAG: hypothetical protein ABR607_00675 [Pyrinomonadaceae bacterium]
MAQHLVPLVLVAMLVTTPTGFPRVFQPRTSAEAIASGSTENPRSRKAIRKRANVQQRALEDILTDPALWGKGFPSALATLPAFARAGEKQVIIFHDRMLGGTKFRDREEADQQARRLSDALKSMNASPRSAKLKAYLGQRDVRLRPEVVLLADDRSYRVAAMGQELLPARLMISDVRKRLGKEERITTELLDDGTERRPVILTLHHYAGGAIIFAESDWSPIVGSVDRVFLDASRISTSLF